MCYKKQKKRVALCHEKIRNQRKDFQHKLSASLAESFDAICVEDLNLKGMAESDRASQIQSAQRIGRKEGEILKLI